MSKDGFARPWCHVVAVVTAVGVARQRLAVQPPPQRAPSVACLPHPACTFCALPPCRLVSLSPCRSHATHVRSHPRLVAPLQLPPQPTSLSPSHHRPFLLLCPRLHYRLLTLGRYNQSRKLTSLCRPGRDRKHLDGGDGNWSQDAPTPLASASSQGAGVGSLGEEFGEFAAFACGRPGACPSGGAAACPPSHAIRPPTPPPPPGTHPVPPYPRQAPRQASGRGYAPSRVTCPRPGPRLLPHSRVRCVYWWGATSAGGGRQPWPSMNPPLPLPLLHMMPVAPPRLHISIALTTCTEREREGERERGRGRER